MQRRNLIRGVLAFLGFAAIAKTEEQKLKTIKFSRWKDSMIITNIDELFDGVEMQKGRETIFDGATAYQEIIAYLPKDTPVYMRNNNKEQKQENGVTTTYFDFFYGPMKITKNYKYGRFNKGANCSIELTENSLIAPALLCKFCS